VLWLAIPAATAFTLLRLFGLDFSRYTVVALAVTPQALAGALVLTGLTVLLRRAWAAGVAGLAAAVLAAFVVPRALPDDQPALDGQPLVVASANLHFGEGAPDDIVELVRDRRVDVLSLQELTPDAVRALDAVGLAQLLPYRLFREADGARGSGLASRFPLHPSAVRAPSRHEQPAALIDLPGLRDVEIVAIHPVQPLIQGDFPVWQRELAALPPPRGDDTIRLLAGDFNATLDHPEFARLLADGWADAADRAGSGLRATWPAGKPWPPFVTIDHVLVDPRCAVRSFDTVSVDGSDHRAIVAALVVPGR
jgi:endonuclease/exonuclease/phosphatase (EEP) superfamily protein YafD